MIGTYQARCQQRVDTALDTLFDAPRSEVQRLYQAMRYSVVNGGKRVRPLLVYAACEAFPERHLLRGVPVAGWYVAMLEGIVWQGTFGGRRDDDEEPG